MTPHDNSAAGVRLEIGPALGWFFMSTLSWSASVLCLLVVGAAAVGAVGPRRRLHLIRASGGVIGINFLLAPRGISPGDCATCGDRHIVRTIACLLPVGYP
jgi:hypothetical protein